MLGKINDNEHSKYHMYDSIPSYILVFFRVVAVLTFFVGVGLSIIRNKKDPRIVNFFQLYTALGTLYFLSLPLAIVGSKIFNESYR